MIQELDAHPDHHLWRNGNVWWVAFTFHFGGRKYRVRRSLSTREVQEAREKRDTLLSRYASKPGWRLSLRFTRSPEDETCSLLSA